MPGCAAARATLDVTLHDLEMAGVHAWPAHETARLGGWLWRFSNGGSQRANSVATLGEPGMELCSAIDAAEQLYRARGRPAWFQVTDASRPGGLDAALADSGYEIREPCTTLRARLAPEPANEAGIEIRERVTADWFEAYASVITPDRRAQAMQILERVPSPRAFCAVRRNGAIVATALAVVNGRAAVFECVATLASARRTGGAAAVMRAAMAWAGDAGATDGAVGVVAANAAAQALYARLGFRLAGRYHIRAKVLE